MGSGPAPHAAGPCPGLEPGGILQGLRREAAAEPPDPLVGNPVVLRTSSTRELRAQILPEGTETRVFVEQTTVVDPRRLGPSAGRVDAAELRAVDEALVLLLGL